MANVIDATRPISEKNGATPIAIAEGFAYVEPTSIQSQIDTLGKAIDRMAFLEQSWDGETAEPPNAASRELAKHALTLLPSGTRPSIPSRVSPSVEGGIAFTWRVERGDALIEFYNDGEIVALVSNRKDFPTSWDVERDGLKSALETLVQFVYG